MLTAPMPPSGRQSVIRHGDCTATIVEVGGGLRSFDSGSRAVLWAYGEGEMCTGGRGQVLVPWPNRLRDGAYRLEGIDAQAALDEPGRRNAIHGLVRWLDWKALDHADDAVSLACTLSPQPGYPWRLELRVEYRLSDAGLAVTLTATNRAGGTAPFGAGFHPYVDAGPGGVDACRLHLAAERRIVTDHRGIPNGTAPVDGEHDFGVGRSLEGVVLDDCYRDLGRAVSVPGLPEEAAWSAEVVGDSGRGAVLWGTAAWPYLMCFTGDALPAEDRRKGVALEPMTCPPDAFHSGEGLILLEPGEEFSGAFGVIPQG